VKLKINLKYYFSLKLILKINYMSHKIMNPPPPTKPKTRQPAGAEKYDEGALNSMQQIKTNEKKVN